MKFLVVSDIHGSENSSGLLKGLLEKTGADRIICCGDVLYHGPRNPLPEYYNPKQVSTNMNELKEKIIAVRGNCDGEVDQMMLEFPVLDTCTRLYLQDREIFVTHGHVHSPSNHPSLPQGTAFLSGHTHIPTAFKENGIYYLNPGSLTLPKENHPRSYAVLTESGFTVYSLEGEVIRSIEF